MSKIKRWVLNKLLGHLFNAVTADDVIRLEKGKLKRGSKILPEKDAASIISGARALQTNRAFEEILKSLKLAANKRMYEKSKSDEDIVFGKATLWAVDVIERKVNNLSQINKQNIRS